MNHSTILKKNQNNSVQESANLIFYGYENFHKKILILIENEYVFQ